MKSLLSVPPMKWVQRASMAVKNMDWPRQLALVLVCVACASLLGAWQLEHYAQRLQGQNEEARAARVLQGAQPAPQLDTLAQTPEDTQYIRDLELMFQLGQETGVSFGAIDYKLEVNARTPVFMRTVDLRLNEDYPKIKLFVSKVLQKLPHAALQEIRVERKDAQTIQGAMLLKLALVYQPSVMLPSSAVGDKTP